MAGLTLALWLISLPTWAGTMTVDMLDVGQGDAILITSPEGKRVLIDAGEDKARVVDQLTRLGVTELALVVATHPHADHIGGMADVLSAFPPRLYLDNGLSHTTQTYTSVMATVEERGIRYQTAVVGNTVRLDDGIVLTVLWPGERPLNGTRSDLNSNSVVLRLDHGDDCFLFTGDAEQDTERALLRRELASCDVLKVAHHGSDHSTTSAFLSAVQPRIALISVGADNRYGHPGDETVRRLQRAGVTIYRTDHSGHVRLASDGTTITVVDGLPWWSPPSPDSTTDASENDG
ncbi:MAG: MBL fold metallo-hydrolase [Alphaproteobacteria bacterium]|nr:MBL fold metallo-hydrolase [Alphaproteobacteria bacterium]